MVQHDVSAEPASGTQARRVWVSSFLGATIEFYDFSIYSTASALVFAPLFFSGTTPAVGLVLSFATLAIGYAARPIGAVLFGHYGDRLGRKNTLIATIVLMAVATTLIGCLPTAETLGSAAAVFLVLLRLLQGVSVGGEWGGAVVMSTEHSPSRWRAFMGSSTLTGASAGVLLGFAAFAVIVPLSGDAFLTWGWRVPFWVTAVLFVLALYMRLKITESPVMRRMQEQPGAVRRIPIKEIVQRHPVTVLKGAGVFAGVFMLQQVMLSFVVSYGVSDLGHSRAAMVNASMIGVAVSFVGIPLAGLLTDRFGRRPILLTGLVLQLLNAFVLWTLVTAGSYALIVVAFALVFLFHSLCYAPLGALYSELFPSAVRYTGVSLCYQVATLVGGFGPLVAALLVGNGQVGLWVTGLLVLGMLVALACGLILPRTDDVDLTTVGEQPPEASARTPERAGEATA